MLTSEKLTFLIFFVFFNSTIHCSLSTIQNPLLWKPTRHTISVNQLVLKLIGFIAPVFIPAAIAVGGIVLSSVNSDRVHNLNQQISTIVTDLMNISQQIERIREFQNFHSEMLFNIIDFREAANDLESFYARDGTVPRRFLRSFNISSDFIRVNQLPILKRCDLEKHASGYRLRMNLVVDQIEDNLRLYEAIFIPTLIGDSDRCICKWTSKVND